MSPDGSATLSLQGSATAARAMCWSGSDEQGPANLPWTKLLKACRFFVHRMKLFSPEQQPVVLPPKKQGRAAACLQDLAIPILLFSRWGAGSR